MRSAPISSTQSMKQRVV